MLITILQEVMCVILGFIACRLAPKLLYTIQTPNTFENRNVIRYNLRIFPRIFSVKNIFSLKSEEK